jgi:hypothetical protein
MVAHGYVRRPGTDRIPEEEKKFLRNRNRDSCEKSATGEENTGILRIPAGITNLERAIAADTHRITRVPCDDFFFCFSRQGSEKKHGLSGCKYKVPPNSELCRFLFEQS